jgi:hypothetical protein
MFISIDIIKKWIEDNVVEYNLHENTGMILNGCAFFETEQQSFFPDCLYVCKNAQLVKAEELPSGANFVFVGLVDDAITEKLAHVNYLIVEGITIFRLFNRLLDVFRRYSQLDASLTELIQQRRPLQEVIDHATEIVGMPLCLLDLNYRVLGISQKIDIQHDKLWHALKQGYGLPYYDYIKVCDVKLEELSRSNTFQKEVWSQLAENYLHVRLILRNGRPIASLGMHKLYEFKKPFDTPTIQLFDYIVGRLEERAIIVDDIPESRNNPFDLFLIDLVNGNITTQKQLAQQLQELGVCHIQKQSGFYLGILYPKDESCRTERFFSLMATMEHILPDTHCCIYDSNIVFLRGIQQEDASVPTTFTDFLQRNGFFCVFSLKFGSYLEIRDTYHMLHDLRKFLLPKRPEAVVYWAQDYLQEYALTKLSERMDLSKLIHPVIATLLAYDAREKTDLYDILKIYLQNNCNLKVTSDSIFMHRNTVSSKLSHIKSLTDLDFDDPKQLKQLRFSIECRELSLRTTAVSGSATSR